MKPAVPAAKATTPGPAGGAAPSTQYLTFTLGAETFALAILNVREIIEYAGVTEVPMMSDCIRGVINLRGSVVTVMDLAARFGRRPSAVTKRTCIVIVEIDDGDEQHVVGVVVDAVNAVLEIDRADIEPPPTFGARIRGDFIEGMGKVNNKFVILLDIGKVFSVHEIAGLTAAQPLE